MHAAAWKAAFDAYLREHPPEDPGLRRPFDVRDDYPRYVDGKSRLDGAAAFLASRGFHPSADDTVQAVAAEKERLFTQRLREHGVDANPGTIRLVRALRRAGIPRAAASASRHAGELLTRAGVLDLFDVLADGGEAARLELPGKPRPDLFLEAARRLGVPAGRELDWDGYRELYGDIRRLDRILESGGDTVNRYQASKQADVLMLGYLFSPAERQGIVARLGFPLDEDTWRRTVDRCRYRSFRRTASPSGTRATGAYGCVLSAGVCGSPCRRPTEHRSTSGCPTGPSASSRARRANWCLRSDGYGAAVGSAVRRGARLRNAVLLRAVRRRTAARALKRMPPASAPCCAVLSFG